MSVNSVGEGTVIFPFASIGHIPQDLKFGGEKTKLIIGARNRIREHVTMNPGTEGGGGLTKVGDDGLYMMGVHVGHDCIVGDRVILANNASLGGHCIIADNVIIGALAGVHQFCRVGRGAMIGGLAAVVADVIPYGMVMGERADLAGLNLTGLKRAGVDRATISAVRATFKELFAEGGSLNLPRLLAEHCATQGRTYTVVGFGNAALKWAVDHPLITAQFEKPARMFKAIKSAGCTQVVFAGGMARPQLNPLKFDFKMLKLAPSLLPAIKSGDNVTLRAIENIFASEGFEIVAADDILSELIAKEGCDTRTQPDADDLADIARGFDVLSKTSSADVGQGVVISGGICIGFETVQGTDAMLAFVRDTAKPFRHGNHGGVLIKAPKPQQSRNMDMPAIGAHTITAAHDAGLRGIAVPDGGALIIDRTETLKQANELGLFLHVGTPG